MRKTQDELADMFGVDSLDDITGDGDALYEEYLQYEKDQSDDG